MQLQQLQDEAEALRIQANEYRALKDHIAVYIHGLQEIIAVPGKVDMIHPGAVRLKVFQDHAETLHPGMIGVIALQDSCQHILDIG